MTTTLFQMASNPQVRRFSQRRSSHLENLIDSPDPQVPQSCVVPSLAGLPHRQTPFVGLPPPPPIGEGHMDKELGVGKFLPGQRLERDVSVARLKTLQRNGVLACGRKENYK
ncbi:hypothetical protein EYF80_017635 [Liparis tanakae]|uniref:Uncharacterized protein n=1 Tax=Liparis tanakae TaxID=230148 RepID=A0A4Z2I2J2_9TELE|nr:hypothetical protein EYF80_017635 [Liparis tanakae]